MARTYRNRGSVPAGYLVRDGGFVHKLGGEYPTRLDRRKYNRAGLLRTVGSNWTCVGECPDEDWPVFRSRWMSKEKKVWRKMYQREFRAKAKDRMRHEDWENIPRFRRTGGWLTW